MTDRHGSAEPPPTPIAQRPVVNVDGAAELLSVSPSHVRHLVRSGVLCTVPHSGRRVLIARAEIDRFAAQGVAS